MKFVYVGLFGLLAVGVLKKAAVASFLAIGGMFLCGIYYLIANRSQGDAEGTDGGFTDGPHRGFRDEEGDSGASFGSGADSGGGDGGGD